MASWSTASQNCLRGPKTSPPSCIRWACPRLTSWHGSRSEERRVGKECRSLCDWSSDVCSSDLGFMEHGLAKLSKGPENFAAILHTMGVPAPHLMAWLKIGRASCRERV